MPKYAIFFSYSAEAWSAMIDKPGDRTASVRATVEAVGGSVESFYWMFGGWDGILVVDVPDAVSAAATSVAVGSTGALKKLETHELLDQDQLRDVLATAKTVKAAYRAPGT